LTSLSAATSFAVGKDGGYDLKWSGGGKKTSADMVEMAKKWVKDYPIVLWEDPLSENDWDGFARFTERLGGKIEVVGDDFASLGSDLDGAIVPPPDMRSVGVYARLVQKMLDRGWSDERIAKILGGSFLRALALLRP